MDTTQGLSFKPLVLLTAWPQDRDTQTHDSPRISPSTQTEAHQLDSAHKWPMLCYPMRMLSRARHTPWSHSCALRCKANIKRV